MSYTDFRNFVNVGKILHELLNFIDDNTELRIDVQAKDDCVDGLLSRHVYAIFYQYPYCYADIVFGYLNHKQVLHDHVIPHMDQDTKLAIISNKGSIEILLGDTLQNLSESLSQFVTVVHFAREPKTPNNHVVHIVKEIIIRLSIAYRLDMDKKDIRTKAHHLSKSPENTYILGSTNLGVSWLTLEFYNFIEFQTFLLQHTTAVFAIRLTRENENIVLFDKNCGFVPRTMEVQCNTLYRRSRDDITLYHRSVINNINEPI